MSTDNGGNDANRWVGGVGWIGGVGWTSAHPVAKVTRKHPTRHGYEVRRGTARFATTFEAREAARKWADTLNGGEGQ